MDLILALVSVIFSFRKYTPNGSSSSNTKWMHSFHAIDSIFYERPNSFYFTTLQNESVIIFILVFPFQNRHRLHGERKKQWNELNTSLACVCVSSHRSFDRFMLNKNSANQIEWFLEFVASKVAPTPRVNRLLNCTAQHSTQHINLWAFCIPRSMCACTAWW